MIKGAVSFAIKSLNQFPADNGISDTLSPTTIVTGLPPPNYNHMQEFGEYVTVFKDNNPTNKNAPRIVDAIALHHTGNAQGDYYSTSLSTGKQVSRRQFTKLPITQRVIDAVEALAVSQGQPILPGASPAFTWNPNDNPIMDDAEQEPEEDDKIVEGFANIHDGLPAAPNIVDEGVAVVVEHLDPGDNENRIMDIPAPPHVEENIVHDSEAEEEIVFDDESTAGSDEPILFPPAMEDNDNLNKDLPEDEPGEDHESGHMHGLLQI
jgi:hypothetical protein